MDFKEGKEKFIQSWGILGSQWGVNRTMAQVHALLLISPKPIETDFMMEDLKISRGSVNMSLRALLDWGLVHKKLIPGERKEYFFAEKDMWVIVRQIVTHRKKKELDPLISLMEEICNVQGMCNKSDEFCKVTKEIRGFSNQVDKGLDMLVNADSNWFLKTFLKHK